MSADWKEIIRTVAPTIATAFGGPLAGMATTVVSNAILGKPDGNQDEIAAAMAGANPEMLLKLKQAEQDFAVKLKELDIEVEKINAGDRDSARNREIKTGDVWTPRLLGAMVLGAWIYIQWFLLTHIVPAQMREIVLRGLGTLDLAVGLVLGYYFGSSSGSERKNDMLNDALKGQGK